MPSWGTRRDDLRDYLVPYFIELNVHIDKPLVRERDHLGAQQHADTQTFVDKRFCLQTVPHFRRDIFPSWAHIDD